LGEALSYREFARREGCSDTLVRRGVRDGRLPCLAGKKIDSVWVGTGWRREAVGGVRGANLIANTANPKNANIDAVRIEAEGEETLEQAALRLTPDVVTQFATKADAEKVKESYLALLRKLEYDEKSGEVVRISEVSRIVGAEYGRVRSKLMGIAASVAPAAVLLRTPEEVRALIEREVAQALEELAYDGRSGP